MPADGGQTLLFAQRTKGRGCRHRARSISAQHAARFLGRIPDHMLRYPLPTANGLAFVSVRLASDLWLRKPNGTLVNVTKSGHVWEGNRCGRDLIVSEELDPEQDRDPAGRLHGQAPRAADAGAARLVAGLLARRQSLVLPAAHADTRASAAAIGAGCRDIFQGSPSAWTRRPTAGGSRS